MKLLIALIIAITSPILCRSGSAADPSIEWSYALVAANGSEPQIVADGTGGAVVVQSAPNQANPSDSDTIVVWLDDRGTEFYRKVFHPSDGFDYLVSVSRERMIIQAQGNTYLLVTRRGSESSIQQATAYIPTTL